MPDFLRMLGDRAMTKEQLLEAVEDDFELLPIVIDGVSSPKAGVRYGCAKVIMDLSEKHPEKLYPHMEFFASLLNSKYRILVWNAIAILANLCAADVDKKFDAVFDKYYGLLNDEYMVTVANVVGNSGKIALAKPYLVPMITDRLLCVDKIATSPHLTDECKRVIAEAAIESFNLLFYSMDAEGKAKVLSFVKKNLKSPRDSLRKKANLFLRRWSQ